MLLQRSMIATGPALAAGEAQVGVVVKSGQVPADGLVPGDVVQVVALPADAQAQPDRPEVLVRRARVFAAREDPPAHAPPPPSWHVATLEPPPFCSLEATKPPPSCNRAHDPRLTESVLAVALARAVDGLEEGRWTSHDTIAYARTLSGNEIDLASADQGTAGHLVRAEGDA